MRTAPDAAAPGPIRLGFLEATPQAISVMLVLHSHICGGAEKHAVTLLEGFHRQGHRVAFAGPADSWLADTLRQSGFPCYHAPLHGFYDALSVVRLCRAAISFGADVLHGHLTRGAFYAGLAGKLTGRVSVATAHLMNSHKRFGWAGKIIAVSGAVRGHLVEKGQDPNRIAVIHNGIHVPQVPTGQRQRMRRELGLVQGQIALGMVSRLADFKGHDRVIEALARLQNPNVSLFIVGQADGVDWYQVLRRKVRDAGLEQRVRFLGHREDVFDVLQGMDIFVSASRREAFPTSILEACASGVPVIATRVGGTTEIIAHGENGLLFNAGDGDALDGIRGGRSTGASTEMAARCGARSEDHVGRHVAFCQRRSGGDRRSHLQSPAITGIVS